MDLIWIVITVLALVSLIYGLSLTIGMGWAMFIMDLLTQNVTADYANNQRQNPSAKDAKSKQRGSFFIFLGIILALISLALL